MATTRDPATRLLAILERSRGTVAPELPPQLLAVIAEIEEHNRFDEDRKSARQQIRAAVSDAANAVEQTEDEAQ
jgi:hypothetical protein